jgi:hypothetical protein
MAVIAFAGPSLPTPDRAAFPGVDWRPPCEAGDLLRLDAKAGDVLCIIDGWFDHRPSVRHKEILELLSRDIRILGASSIGALRAAEMERFGMEGIGAIFRAYATGRLTGDDEVALAHGPVAWDWRPLSVPLVDVRATLCRALRMCALDRAAVEALLRSAKGFHYLDRTWPDVIAAASLPGSAAHLADRIGRLAVGQKRIDALACVEAALRPGAAPAYPVSPVRTIFLEALAEACGVRLGPPAPMPAPPASPAIPAVRRAETDCERGSTP